MIILEDVVCGAVVVCIIIQRDVSVIEPTLTDINRVDKIIETPVSIKQNDATAPQTAASKMIMDFCIRLHSFQMGVPNKLATECIC